jgi:hypothetical protein
MMYIWLLGYALPASCFFFVSRKFKILKHRVAVMHTGLLISIFLLSFFGVRLHFGFNLFEVAFFFISVLFSLFILGHFGLWYAVSTMIQEYCILLAGILGIEAFGLGYGVLVTAAVFALAHLVNPVNWRRKLSLTLCWGIASLLLYVWLKDPLFNIALHTALGVPLIRMKILFPNLSRWNELDPL